MITFLPKPPKEIPIEAAMILRDLYQQHGDVEKTLAAAVRPICSRGLFFEGPVFRKWLRKGRSYKIIKTTIHTDFPVELL